MRNGISYFFLTYRRDSPLPFLVGGTLIVAAVLPPYEYFRRLLFRC
ncbi:MAG: hypothetical protein AVDCRST_MAG80-2235 [uncultured Rubrobacteraceae bacterium]|uniref:Uncharacterized protein n=1 Tax=uncultured Rubrobacteraceae bacterium TaxID=349277 RepID=A0A6J4QVI7_9ACTN|nr:MAG: hypothetical protein AVDCRST_MAG80-2235 [uncultured Rubrobacteraceae bacterium]